MSLKKIRNQIFIEAKKYAKKNGWNKDIFSKLRHYNYDEMITVFPNGYLSLIQLYLDEINYEMTSESKKLDLIHLKIHERIRELCILRLNIMKKKK